jgi:hypothetical protein
VHDGVQQHVLLISMLRNTRLVRSFVGVDTRVLDVRGALELHDDTCMRARHSVLHVVNYDFAQDICSVLQKKLARARQAPSLNLISSVDPGYPCLRACKLTRARSHSGTFRYIGCDNSRQSTKITFKTRCARVERLPSRAIPDDPRVVRVRECM